jgi:hypothetical protein
VSGLKKQNSISCERQRVGWSSAQICQHLLADIDKFSNDDMSIKLQEESARRVSSRRVSQFMN